MSWHLSTWQSVTCIAPAIFPSFFPNSAPPLPRGLSLVPLPHFAHYIFTIKIPHLAPNLWLLAPGSGGVLIQGFGGFCLSLPSHRRQQRFEYKEAPPREDFKKHNREEQTWRQLGRMLTKQVTSEGSPLELSPAKDLWKREYYSPQSYPNQKVRNLGKCSTRLWVAACFFGSKLKNFQEAISDIWACSHGQNKGLQVWHSRYTT